VRELTGAADESEKQDGRTGPEQKPVFTKRLLRNGLNLTAIYIFKIYPFAFKNSKLWGYTLRINPTE
ncbi:MAG: hypothetical protein RLZZ505_2991, partial [Verrucomicrobiota bacterium]